MTTPHSGSRASIRPASAVVLVAAVAVILILLVLGVTGYRGLGGPRAFLFAVPAILVARVAWQRRRR